MYYQANVWDILAVLISTYNTEGNISNNVTCSLLNDLYLIEGGMRSRNCWIVFIRGNYYHIKQYLALGPSKLGARRFYITNISALNHLLMTKKQLSI